jgi:hypothetical protein
VVQVGARSSPGAAYDSVKVLALNVGEATLKLWTITADLSGFCQEKNALLEFLYFVSA